MASQPKAGRPKKMAGALHRPLPLLGSNQDSPDPESGVLPVTPRGIDFYHGAEGDRTPDLLIANEALSQLSYSPNVAIVPAKVASVPAKVASVPAMKDGKSTG